MLIEWGEWKPDSPDIGLGALRIARNVRPALRHYEPMQALGESSDAIASRARGLLSARDLSGEVHTFTGDTSKLYELSGATWGDVSKVGGYSCAESDRWRFWTFGDRMLATNFSDPIQKFDMSMSSVFANLAGSPPQAKYGASYGEFVVLGYTSDNAQGIKWSAIGDSESWTPGLNQSDVENFSDGGNVTGIGIGDVAYVFQEYAIRRMVYTGGPTIMQFDVMERARGCIDAGSLVQVGNAFFYRSPDGFYLLNNGVSTPIGFEKVDEYFKDNADLDLQYRTTAAIDPINKLAGWLYTSNDSATGAPDRLLIYNWAAQRWAEARYSAEVLASTLSSGYTLEGLDALYGSIDAMTISLDDPIWTGGALNWGAMTTNNKLASFSGSNLEATIETDDFQISEGLIAFVQQCRPLTDAATAYCKTGYRMRAGDALAYSTESAINVSGFAPQRALGRYIRTNHRIPAAETWTKTQGTEMMWTPSGMQR
jgi:hypothetical protein